MQMGVSARTERVENMIRLTLAQSELFKVGGQQATGIVTAKDAEGRLFKISVEQIDGPK